ncbi:DNA-3-methyladenine glycosylase 2 family protein [Klugiella xanthotipulae]|uniref:DNA-3-methyladenine glycosylase II n=1 Tax=Klugiella xanthotipulae TaxID=244735 RepID=A0A543I6A3_9MICO|nr:AlkA N-terminal domain-containing protein [Klugiella xanthotipulae]TQM66071.1 DNA-3-methyladenine glycosylase II [Klugiella xanthotipulae]
MTADHVDSPAPPEGGRRSQGDALFAERYRAISARDERFDGQFYTAVSSTGIYCRPSCPARTPRERNVTFYLTSAAAQGAGYRACKRCLPEAVPGSPEWDLRRDLTGRAMRLIADGVVDREGVVGLATSLGYSPRHVHRLLVAELGAGPLALARARRAQTARSLLQGTDLGVADIAFAAGFGSVRQFNDTMLTVFAARPGDVRRGSRSEHLSPGVGRGRAEAAPLVLGLALPVRQPFDAPGVFRFLAARAIRGVEVVEGVEPGPLRYARTLTLPHGPGAVEVTATRVGGSGWRLRVRLELPSLADVATAVSRIRRAFDLDADPVAVDTALAVDPRLAPSVAGTPGIRVPGTVDPHEQVIRAIVGQQISVGAARTQLSRLAARVGAPYASSFAGLSLVFPSPAQIVAGVPEPVAGEPLDPDRPLRLPGASLRTVVSAARDLADGTLRVDVGSEPGRLREQLVARRGIGPWTAAYLSMRALGDPDAWLDGDVALVSGAVTLGVLDPAGPRPQAHRILAERARAWAPWRSYAAMHLWRA